jgi:carboxypeptidase PM20D1
MGLKIVLLANIWFFYSITMFCQETLHTMRIWVNGHLHDPAELLSLYIQQKSVTGEEKAAGEWMKNVCVQNGLHITDFGLENSNYNFAASIYPLDGIIPNIVLLNHIDVVHEGDEKLWEHPPYKGVITETEVWGRGSHDNKGTAVMQLFAMLAFRDGMATTKMPFNISFLSVSCEETMCSGGVDYVVENHLRLLNPSVVIGEGATELNNIIQATKTEPLFGISRAHKRPLWLELSLHIPSSGHGSVTPLEYATKNMTIALANLAQKNTPFIYTPENKSVLKSIGDHKSGITRFILKNPVFFKILLRKQLRKQPEIYALFTNTVTITSLNSGNGTINQIPERVTATLDCRLLPEFPVEEKIRFIKNALRDEKIEINVLQSMAPSQISDMDNIYYNSLKEALEGTYHRAKVVPVILPIFNEIGKFRLLGIQGYGITPVQLELTHLHCIHSVNERIPIYALYKGGEVYYRFLENVYQNGLLSE